MAEKFLTPAGSTIVVEPMAHLHSVSVGIWAKAGSAAEDKQISGVSHFLEHMLFKGTEQRSALDIAAAMESLGGVLNAFTGKEYTCYYTRSLDEHFDQSLELLADMYNNSLLDAEEFAKEKNVIIEEINMYEDSPDDRAIDLLSSILWPDHPYGRAISGTLDTVSALTRDQLAAYRQSKYSPENTVISVAGNVDQQYVIDAVNKYFSANSGEKNHTFACTSAPVSSSTYGYIYKNIEQTHVCLGFPGISIADDDYYATQVLINALGGGASSRLFQEVREKRGLSYSAYAYMDTYSAGGSIAAYASTRPSNIGELINVMVEEIANVAAHGLVDGEIEKSKTQLKGGLLLGMESSSNVMNRLGRLQLQLGRILPVGETLEKLMQVNREDIERVCNRLLKPGYLSMAIVGPEQYEVDPKELY